MGADQHHDWMAGVASALDWWQEAGVDTLVDEAPRDWLAQPMPDPAAFAPAAPPTPATVAAAAMPDLLADFIAWRGGDQVPEVEWRGVSIAASGPADAAVMVLVDCPDKDDGAAGMLMSGETGALFDRMLAAIGLSRESIYLIALTSARPLGDRLPPETLPRLGQLARHHLSLVAPRRVLLLGQAVSRAIGGTDGGGGQGNLQPVNLNGSKISVVSSLHPRFLLKQPAMKAEAWKDLQLLMGGSR